MTLSLRDYQRASLDALYAHFKDGGKNGLIVLPTGAGKALVIAALITEILSWYPDKRVAVVTHTKELIRQNFDELKGYWPGAPAGIYSAGLGRKDTKSKILFCGIASVHNKTKLLGQFDFVIVDECFPAGTMISTPDGLRAIETIKPGDVVEHALGFGKVRAVSSRQTTDLVKVTLSNGEYFVCTPNHPIFTAEGFVQAGKLEVGGRVFRSQDLRELRQRVHALGQEGNQRGGDLSAEAGPLGEAAILQHLLLEAERERDVHPGHPGENVRDTQADRSSAECQGREWRGINGDTGRGYEDFGQGLDSRVRCSDESWTGERLPQLLQARSGEHFDKNRDRVGRQLTSWGETGAGSEERRASSIVRVAGVSRVECGREVSVFNLDVSGHPSYFADGVLAHNCHLIPRNDDTYYGRFLRDQAGARLIGLTATPFRLDSGRLNTGEDAMFEAVVYDANVRDLIEQGYLSPLISKATLTKLDTTGVAKRGGDYVPGQLAAAVDQEVITRDAVAEIVERGADRRAWLAFCCSVEHAIHVRDEIRRHGIACETVTGETPAGERERIIRDFKGGRIRCLTSMAVLTTGFNVPAVDMLALLRPTKSAGLYIQMVGRAMRRAQGKDNALVLDFAGCVREHGPIDCVSIKQPGEKAGVSPTKECEHCHSYMPISAKVCEDCGEEFPAIERGPREIKIEREADGTSLILSNNEPTWLSVKSWRFRVHEKTTDDKVSRTLRVDFYCGLSNPPIWICPEHKGAMRHKAEQWWARMGGSSMPITVEGCVAMSARLRRPSRIKVRPNGKYTDVIGYEFDEIGVLEAAE